MVGQMNYNESTDVSLPNESFRMITLTGEKREWTKK